jgi:hypothetical protein
MTVAQVDQFALKFSIAQRGELLRQGLSALPSCWGRRAESCAGEADGPYLSEPQCSAIMGGYFGDSKKMADAVDRVPLCEEGSLSKGGPPMIVLALASAVFGGVLWSLLSSR